MAFWVLPYGASAAYLDREGEMSRSLGVELRAGMLRYGRPATPIPDPHRGWGPVWGLRVG